MVRRRRRKGEIKLLRAKILATALSINELKILCTYGTLREGTVPKTTEVGCDRKR